MTPKRKEERSLTQLNQREGLAAKRERTVYVCLATKRNRQNFTHGEFQLSWKQQEQKEAVGITRELLGESTETSNLQAFAPSWEKR